MSEAKTYEPVEGSQDLVIEAFVRAGEGFSVGSEDNPWPYSTEDTGEQAFLDAHSLVKEQGAPEGPSSAESEAEATDDLGEASEAEAGEQTEEAGEQ